MSCIGKSMEEFVMFSESKDMVEARQGNEQIYLLDVLSNIVVKSHFCPLNMTIQ